LASSRHVLEQRREYVQTAGIGDGVQVVQHQHQRAFERRQSATDPRYAVCPRRSTGTGQRVEHVLRERLHPVNRGCDVAQEDDGVVVSTVERNPCERTRISPGPVR